MQTVLKQQMAPHMLINVEEKEIVFANQSAKEVEFDQVSVDLLIKETVFTYQEKSFYLEKITVPFNRQTFLIVLLSEYKAYHKNRVNDLFYSQAIATLMLDNQYNVFAVNQAFTEITGMGEDALLGKSVYDIIIAKDKDKFSALASDLIPKDKSLFETYITNQHHKYTSVDATISVFNMHGIKEGYMISFEPNTIRKDKERQINVLRQVVETFEDAVLITDADFKTQWANNKYKVLNEGFEANVKIDFCADNLEDDMTHQLRISQLKQTGRWQGEAWFEAISKKLTPVWLTIYGLKDEDDRIEFYVATYKNLSQISQVGSSNILTIMRRDPLTTLYNKSHFFDRVTAMISMESEANHHILFIDMNNFKQINDTYGHLVGDLAIEKIAMRLRKLFAGHLIARYGGDEFLVYFEPKNKLEDIEEIIKEAQKMIKEPLQLRQYDVKVDASFGLATYPQDGETLTELLEKADGEMYREKVNHKKVNGIYHVEKKS